MVTLFIFITFIFLIFSSFSSGAMNELGKSIVFIIRGIPEFVENIAIVTFVVSILIFFSLAFKQVHKKYNSFFVTLKKIFKEHELTSFDKLINSVIQLSFAVSLVLGKVAL